MVNVTILTQASCAFCDHAKEILARTAAEYPLDLHEIRMDTEEGRNLAIRNGVMFAPGIFIDDKLFSYGRLSEKKLRNRLDRKG
jgi:glutaredoxin